MDSTPRHPKTVIEYPRGHAFLAFADSFKKPRRQNACPFSLFNKVHTYAKSLLYLTFILSGAAVIYSYSIGIDWQWLKHLIKGKKMSSIMILIAGLILAVIIAGIGVYTIMNTRQRYYDAHVERQSEAPVGFSESLRSVVIQSVNRGSLPVFLVAMLFGLMIGGMPYEYLVKSIRRVIDVLQGTATMGWVLFVCSLILWFTHTRRLRRLMLNELERVAEERRLLLTTLKDVQKSSSPSREGDQEKDTA